MLVLTRKNQQSFVIGDNITITIVDIGVNSVRIGVDAPASLNVVRTELIQKPEPDK